jgi:pimeloyl-ACP methyl ester carboxylesterase
METKTVVFIHGMFQNPKSWDNWKKYFEDRGYTCYAPPYPYHDGEPRALRENIDKNLGALTLGKVVDTFAAFIDQLPEKPILIGHSMGGLIVQKLIGMNKGVAGVCIDTAAPKGISILQWSFFKANIPIINPLMGNAPYLPSVKWFQYAFCNTMTMEQARKEYEESVVPESRNVPRSSTGTDGWVDLKKPHSPLLFIVGEKDHIIPSSLNRKNYEAYADKASKKKFKEFSGRTHYICGQDKWQEVADYVISWL